MFSLSQAGQSSYEDYAAFPVMSARSGGQHQQQEEDVPEHLSFPVRAFELSRDMLRTSLPHCQSAFIGRTLDLLCGSDLVLSVYERVEGATELGNKGAVSATHNVLKRSSTVAHSDNGQSSHLSEGSFSRDGILMQPSAVVKPLMKYALSEVRRRNTQTMSGVVAGKGAEASGADLEELVGVLQRSENHLLATRVMFSSWVSSANKAQVSKMSVFQGLCPSLT